MDILLRIAVLMLAGTLAAKEIVLARLKDAPIAERPALHKALDELRGELRRNLVLLAHARDYLREAVEMCAKPGGRARLQAKL